MPDQSTQTPEKKSNNSNMSSRAGENIGTEEDDISSTVGLSKTRTCGDTTTKQNLIRFSDHDEFGFYNGELLTKPNSGEQIRHGYGTMIYDSGNTHTGSFVDNKFHGNNGTYHWHDGDEQQGSWFEGKRHGNSIFKCAVDGTVEYLVYEHDKAVGEGVLWSADRQTAYRMKDGVKDHEISLGVAEKFATEIFGLDVPEPSTVVVPSKSQLVDVPPPTSKSIGLLGRLFSSRKVGPDGTLYFKDYGEWGSYDGLVNDAGDRQGYGKMTYDSGNYYEGGFVNDKFHGNNGVYHWQDGDEYSGGWKDGERHGIGSFTQANGTVEYSMYDSGIVKGDGVSWSADRKTTHKLVDGEKKIEMLTEEAEMFAREKFNLPVPEPASTIASTTDSTTGVTSSKSIGLLGRLFSSRKVGADGTLFVKDYGDWGSYAGSLDDSGKRYGQGKMTYDSGNYYEGTFKDDKFHGDKGVYHWQDGDEYNGSWKDGERNGIGIFKKADGTVEYAIYENGDMKGEGVSWSADRKTAHKLVDGEKKIELLLEEAETLSMEKFNLPIPEPSSTTTEEQSTAVATVPNTNKQGFLGRLFAKQKVGADGKMLYKDYGEWGSYEGDVDSEGNRTGRGKMTYDSGNYYEGGFADNKFHGDNGVYHWQDGDEYSGGWEDGERNGIGSFTQGDGSVEYSLYKNGDNVGDGLAWSLDRKTAHKLVDGVKKNEISLAMAEKLAKDQFDLSVPPSSVSTPLQESVAVSTSSKNTTGFLGRLFSSRKVDKDGRPMYKDYGDWGSYEGVVDENGKRQGEGEMKYISGNYYKGGFMDNKFHGDKGVYHWQDGDEYDGSWKNGERNGIGSFTKADGSIEYAIYEEGAATEGIWFSADRKTAYSVVDGEKKIELLLEEAETLSEEKFNLPIPEVAVDGAKSIQTAPKQGFFRSLFSKRKVGADGKILYKDYGEWGSYEGDVDSEGNRTGRGKMTYDSGKYYEGGFVNDKFHGDDGIYHWQDGDEYSGGWEDGERHGIGSFTQSNGSVEYSMYEKGNSIGEGVTWSSDRKTAHKMNGDKKGIEISLAVAEQFTNDKFGLPVPGPLEPTITQPESKSWISGRLFLSKSNDTSEIKKEGPRFVDHGDSGTYYEGTLVDGLRQGEGKMSYDSGNSYEGDFANDKFDGNRGLYRWRDGTEYEGSWREGVFHSIGIFRTPGVGVDYAIYDQGKAVGVGILWSEDYTKAYHTLDGIKCGEMPLADATKLAKSKFNLPQPKSSTTSSKSIGLLGRLFSSKKVGADGKIQFKDYGDWGTYDGELNEAGNRHGQGKMTYDSGNYYEGGFVNNKFHGDSGIYHWQDGDEYKGSWKDGERHGVGLFKNADGSVEYSMYEAGEGKGDGVKLSSDRQIAHKLDDGEPTTEMSIAEAEALIREKFTV